MLAMIHRLSNVIAVKEMYSVLRHSIYPELAGYAMSAPRTIKSVTGAITMIIRKRRMRQSTMMVAA